MKIHHSRRPKSQVLISQLLFVQRSENEGANPQSFELLGV